MTVFHFILVFMGMIFMHIIDDYCLQGILASMKQKKWWQDNYPDDEYKYDYIPALICHSFSWSFMIHIPIAILYLYFDIPDTEMAILFGINIIINAFGHAFIDNMKANKLSINLILDQLMHLVQIVYTYLFFVICECLL